MKLEKIDHICIAVQDLDKARQIYEGTLGLELDTYYVVDKEKYKGVRYYIGDVALELLESTSPDGDVGRFVARRGEGFFLISYRVPDVQQALAELKEKGNKLIDDKPRSIMGSRYAFINHPRELCGVLTEVTDKGP